MKNIIKLLLIVLCICGHQNLHSQGKPFMTSDITINNRGDLVMIHKNINRVDLLKIEDSEPFSSVSLSDSPTGIACNGKLAYITTFTTVGTLHILDMTSGDIIKSIAVGSGANSPQLSSDKSHVYVSNQFENSVTEIDILQQKVTRTVNVLREPRKMVVSPNGDFLFVSNFLPAQRADLDDVAAAVSVINTKSFTKTKDIRLSNGSNALRGMCITPDGKYIYVSHNLGRFQVPTSQLQQGWMNTSAFSIIDVDNQTLIATILVDDPDRGAAGVWDIECTADELFISHSGTHEISIINQKAMLDKLDKYVDKSKLNYDLNFLYGMRTRIAVEGNGPRNFTYRNGELYVPTYFADILNIINIYDHSVRVRHLNPKRVESAEHAGERIFNDADYCFQNWQSCNGCHPGDGRTDGMNWDLLNDGVGNPKNCKSLLLTHSTGRSMISGIRPSAEIAVRAGFKAIQFSSISEEDALKVDAYIKSLKPVESPYLQDGKLNAKAVAGREVFNKLKCGECHSGPNYTDMKTHRIGNDIEFEDGWDTPTLREVWRTSPYLFDGRANTMEDVFKQEKHGINGKLSEKDLQALVEYVNSL